MKHVGDFEPAVVDPVEHRMSLSDEVAPQASRKLIS
jgi:hypothetical protein